MTVALEVGECVEQCETFEIRFGRRCTAIVVSHEEHLDSGTVQCWLRESIDVAECDWSI